MATVIIPAHNESKVILGCLESVTKQHGVDKIIVACNGCIDDTVSKVRSINDERIVCLEIDIPSKVNALNEARKVVDSWPIFYIDADTQLGDNCVTTVSEGMQESNYLLAAPEPVIELSESSWLVRQYYRIWLKLPYVTSGIISTCSYVLSYEGSSRFKVFPDVIADDAFIRGQFSLSERGNINGASIKIKAPLDYLSLIKIKTRARLGNVELKARNLEAYSDPKHHSTVFLRLLMSRDFVPATIYVLTNFVIRLRAKLQYRNISNYEWEVDHSTR